MLKEKNVLYILELYTKKRLNNNQISTLLPSRTNPLTKMPQNCEFLIVK